MCKTKVGITRKIKTLLKGKYSDSIAPGRMIAAELKDNLIFLGIPKEDHLIFVLNRI